MTESVARQAGEAERRGLFVAATAAEAGTGDVKFPEKVFKYRKKEAASFVSNETADVFYPAVVLLFRQSDFQVKFFQLFGCNGRRRIVHNIASRVVFWESNHITDGIQPGK